MNNNILLFSVNRHQKVYFDCLLAAVKVEDNGLSLHKRELAMTLPCFTISEEDLALTREVCSIRAQYSENKSGVKTTTVKRTLYFITSLFFLLKVKKFMSNNSFDIILLWNDMKWHQYIIKKLAESKEVKTAFFENGTLPETVTFDPKGVNYNNSMPRDHRFYLDRYCKEESNRAPAPLLEISTVKSGYIFVPFQVDYDTQIISHSPWIDNMEDFYQVLERLVIDLPEGLNVIIKEHPASSRCYQHLHDKNPRIEFRNTEDTNVLISNSEMVITINSTVGLESIIEGKPVIVLGKAFYAIEGLCCYVEKESDLISKIMALSFPNDNIKNAFVRYLKDQYYVFGNWRSPSVEHVKAIEKRLYEILKSA